MIPVFAAVVAFIGWVPFAASRYRSLVHILQLEEYQTRRFVPWCYANLGKVVLLPASVGATLIALAAFVQNDSAMLTAGIAGGALHLLAWFRRDRTPAKKALAWTPRVKRLTAVTAVISAIIIGVLSLAGLGGFLLGLGLVAGVAGPLVLALATVLAEPIEEGYRRYYLASARNRLKTVSPLVIGVTGSYGKTTTKEIIAAIAEQAGSTLKPPGSTNTLMGVTRQIRERLEDGHEYFVCEMGDYTRGDIRQLCKLVSPRIGVLTTIGPEHLERFGSMENIVLAKRELFEELPHDGVMIVNVDNDLARSLADSSPVRVVRVGLCAENNPDVSAANIQTTSNGIAFDLVRHEQPPVAFESQLLGRHNVLNLLLGIAVGIELGLSNVALREAVKRVKTPDHRLQVINTPGGATIIDDAYNANPVGVAAALDVLAEFPSNLKVLVTPGMVELGSIEADENRRFGEHAAQVCDYVMLVGPKRTEPILSGLRSAGFPHDRAIVVNSLSDVTQRLATLVGAGDVVLFCNDLPDQYAE